VGVAGQLVFSTISMILKAATAGFGLAFVLEGQAAEHLADGRLVRVLAPWCPPFSGYRRQLAPAFALLVEALRYREARSASNEGRGKVR
jgi:DNA-binding transcriptional LysR family regulator